MSLSPAYKGVRIVATGAYLPTGVLDNTDLSRTMDTTEDWIIQRTGIQTRHIAAPDQTAKDMACLAVKDALSRANWKASSLDHMFVASITADMTCPSISSRVIAEIGATPAGATDIQVACSGFVYALNHAAGLIRSGFAKRIAIVGSETMSRAVNYDDRRTCILFGDGASCALLEADDDAQCGCLLQRMHSDGRAWPELYVPHRLGDIPKNRANLFNGRLNTLQMNGQEVFKFAVKASQKAVLDTLKDANIEAHELDMIVSHQSNKRILEMLRHRLRLPEDKLHINIDKYGNTSAASTGLVLHDLMLEGRIKRGDLILFTAVGAGMCWATSLWRV